MVKTQETVRLQGGELMWKLLEVLREDMEEGDEDGGEDMEEGDEDMEDEGEGPLLRQHPL